MGQLIEFPDVSFYQGSINWDIMASKTQNIIIRAGQNLWPDEQFDINWAQAKQHAIRRSCYWFFDSRVTPTQQFEVLKGLIKTDLPEQRCWIDWEESYGGPYPGLKNVVSLMKMVEQTFPSLTVGIYTNYYYFEENSNPNTHAAEYEYLSKHPLWIAAYGGYFQVPTPWQSIPTQPELHQYGTPTLGNEFGCQSLEIDMNRVINNPGNIYLEGEPMTPTPIPNGWYATTVAQGSILNIRNTPGGTGSATDIGDLPYNSIALVDSTETVSGVIWYHLIDARLNRDPNGTPIATSNGKLVSQRSDCWASSQYLIKTTIPVTPPSSEDDPPVEATIVTLSGKVYKSTNFTEV